MSRKVESKPIGMKATRNKSDYVREFRKDGIEAQVPLKSGSIAGVRPRGELKLE